MVVGATAAASTAVAVTDAERQQAAPLALGMTTVRAAQTVLDQPTELTILTETDAVLGRLDPLHSLAGPSCVACDATSNAAGEPSAASATRRMPRPRAASLVQLCDMHAHIVQGPAMQPEDLGRRRQLAGRGVVDDLLALLGLGAVQANDDGDEDLPSLHRDGSVWRGRIALRACRRLTACLGRVLDAVADQYRLARLDFDLVH